MAHRQTPRGTVVSVLTNSFEIKSLPTKEYIQYDIFTPEVKAPRKRQELVHKLQTVVAPNVFSPRAVYDGNAIMYASHSLQLAAGNRGSFTVGLGSIPAVQGARGCFDITITQTIGAVVKTVDMNRLIKDRQADNQTTMATNLLQLLVRQDTNQKYVNNGKAYFVPEGSKRIGMGLEVWRGYFQSVRPTIDKMLVNVDTSISAVYMGGDLISVCLDVIQRKNVRDLQLDKKDVNFRILERHLKDLLINVKTTGARTKVIRGLVPFVGRYEFHKDGQTTTIKEHYQAAHNITLQHPEIFGILLSGRKAPRPIIVPAELCTILHGQLYKKRIPDQLTKSVVDFSTVRPADRLNQIVTGGNRLESPVRGYVNSEFLIEAGMVVSTNPVTIQGRILDTPALKFGGREVRPRDGAWNVLGQKFQKPMPMAHWAAVNFCPGSINSRHTEDLMRSLSNSCQKLGMQITRPVALDLGMGHAVEKVLTNVLDKARAAANGRFESSMLIILVILPTKAAPIRARVKHWGDVTEGVHTQCLREDKVMKANDQYWNNVALKLNARLGGYNCLTNSAIMQELIKEPFMVMGSDVGHPAPGATKPSVTSLVWSHDQYATRYAAFTRLQHPRVEVIAGLKDMVKGAIDAFGSAHRASPRRIFFFRDGVSEGEFEHIASQEIGAIKEAFNEIWTERKLSGPKPLLTFIVVGKKHHVVFFPQDERTKDRTGNCRAGFVADQGVSHPVTVDFYLQSHAAVKGTSRSSHYSVLADENFHNNLDKLQELAFALCHVYAKATRSVSIPAPVYYADLVCSRGDFHFHPDSNMNFTDDTTTASGSTRAAFDLGEWEGGFLPLNKGMATSKSMYFL